MIVKLIEAPTQEDWCKVKRRALVTIGKEMVKEPEWTSLRGLKITNLTI